MSGEYQEVRACAKSELSERLRRAGTVRQRFSMGT